MNSTGHSTGVLKLPPSISLLSPLWGRTHSTPPRKSWQPRRARVVLGAERLTHLGFTSSTALVERVNLPLRQALASLARMTSSFCKDRTRMRQRVVFVQACYNKEDRP